VLHGTDTVCSDLDILVDPISDVTTLFSLVNIAQEIETLTGFKADVFTPQTLKESFRDAVVDEAVSI
jgi:predicted nucleotidyltransferase